MIKKIAATVLILFVSLSLFAKTEIIPMEDVNKPGVPFMWADEQRVYVSENESVLIFSLKDMKLIKQFGKRGEGPQEFMLNPAIPMWLDVLGDSIIVESFGKLSWWTKEGRFIKEFKMPNPLILRIMPFGKNFVGMSQIQGGSTWLQTLSIYDDKLQPVKQVLSMPNAFSPGKGTNAIDILPLHYVYGDKLFTSWDREFKIDVWDKEGKKLYQITTKFENRKVTAQDKKDMIEFFKTSPMTKTFFEMLKPFKFPEKWPAIGYLSVENDKVYTLTTSQFEDRNISEVFILDLKGKLLKKTKIPVQLDGPVMPYPMIIKNNKLYQLVENIDDEQWEMHITEIK